MILGDSHSIYVNGSRTIENIDNTRAYIDLKSHCI